MLHQGKVDISARIAEHQGKECLGQKTAKAAEISTSICNTESKRPEIHPTLFKVPSIYVTIPLYVLYSIREPLIPCGVSLVPHSGNVSSH
ncbi:hypothetical protein Nepgr_033976 [Nepenthes gracilis]|uniref:Uncharacterized protein n=1 Tax=Nepenthes gracilis TaxID=150966 RepID=A0AAD3TN76_NEPGR|nr:hypothetical protein Nepgr_033976 [Nepenthes gracilis]